MDLLDRLLEHDRWTTNQVLAICRTLSPQQLQQPFDVGHGTMDETLRHMIANIQIWTDLMAGGPVRSREALHRADMAEMSVLYESIYADFAALARRVQAEGRLDEVYYDTLRNPPEPYTLGGTIVHVISHDMQHRVELLHMLGKLGAPEVPEGDVLYWEVVTGEQQER